MRLVMRGAVARRRLTCGIGQMSCMFSPSLSVILFVHMAIDEHKVRESAFEDGSASNRFELVIK